MDVRPVRRSIPKLKKVTPTKIVASSEAPKNPKSLSKATSSKKQALFKRLINHPLRNHPFVVPVMTFVMLSFFAMTIFVISNGNTLGASDTRLVKLTIDGEQKVIPTRAPTVKDFLERLEIKVTEQDIIEPAIDTEIFDNSVAIKIYKARPITIIDDGKELTTIIAGQTVRAAVERAGVTIYPEDKLLSNAEVVETEDVLKGRLVAETVVIDRATPANINLYGSNIPIRTHVMTIGEALKEKAIITQPDDVITPSLDSPLAAETQIFITRVGTMVEAREEEIPMPVETINDPTLAVGRTVVRQKGSAGRKVVTYSVQLQNDKEVARTPIQEIIAVAAVKEIIVKGTKPPTIIVSGDHAALMLQAGIPESQHGSAEYIISRESGWRLDARNSGGCLGLGQACPGSKLVNACPEYANDAICQLRFFNGYAVGRYGSWNAAYNFWQVNHWW
jgi:resuscitation-promoting factor RpfB